MKRTLSRQISVFLALSLLALTGAAEARGKITMPLVKGFYDGQEIYYINTEASDAGVAAADGTTFVPKLTNAIAVGATADLFHVTNFAQPNIVDSVPNPLGPNNTVTDYSPLWLVHLVTWQAGFTPQALTSEQAVIAARDAGMVTVTATDIVVNCAVMVTPWSQFPGATEIEIETGAQEISTITLPLIKGYVNGMDVLYINTEASDKNVAIADNTTFAPKLMYAHASGAEADIFPVFGKAHPAQHNVIDSIPTPVGPTNTDPQYSPLWDVVPVQFVNQSMATYPLLRSVAMINDMKARGAVTVGPEPGIIVNCPVVRTPKR